MKKNNCFNCKHGLVEPRGNLGKFFGYCIRIKGKWEYISMNKFYKGCDRK